MSEEGTNGSDGTSAEASARAALASLVEGEPERHPLIVALVAPLGTRRDPVVEALTEVARRYSYRAERVSLSALLDASPYQPWSMPLPQERSPEYYDARMDAGNRLRDDVGNGGALAALATGKIAEIRKEEDPRLVVVDSLKRPEEVDLLRHVYGDAFSLVALVSDPEERRSNLTETLHPFEDSRAIAETLISRDEADSSDSTYGQDVRDTYAMADVYLPAGRGRDVMPHVERFVQGLFGAPFLTPTAHEEAMLHAYESGLRSAAVGRQVGAVLVPRGGAGLVCGTNEVPKPGGGQYRTGDEPDHRDFQSGADPNPHYAGMTVQELLERQRDLGWLKSEFADMSGPELLAKAKERDDTGRSVLAGARAAALIEFTRCLHAEQAAIADAARAGLSTQDAVLYTTTFPCHECAKFIIGAGIVEVHYVEPYPKSLVRLLYSDLIDARPAADADSSRLPGGKVPFRPFVGVAPRRFNAFFTAGNRRSAAGVATIQYDACPRTTGWNEEAVAARENVAITSISRILQALAASAAELQQTSRAGQTAEESPAATGEAG